MFVSLKVEAKPVIPGNTRLIYAEPTAPTVPHVSTHSFFVSSLNFISASL
jgi:hypothetical protein